MTKALGLAESVALPAHTIELAHGDEILLCTDGLTSVLTDAAIEGILGAHAAAAEACATLVDAAARADGPDDITVILARLEA